MASLVSAQNMVEVPFFILHIGDYTFGYTNKKYKNYTQVTFPNYIQSLNIRKINGDINRYTIKLSYQITELDDLNLFERIFSSVSETRLIKLSYGDYSLPNYIYKDEVALMTKIESNVDFSGSKIDYTIHATSNAVSVGNMLWNFPAMFKKPSDVIKSLIKNKEYHLTDIFYGMQNLDDNQLNLLIVGNDKEVEIKAQKNVSLLDYINYLVTCMTAQSDKNGPIKTSRYYWSSFDDVTNEYNGPYFKVISIDTNSPHIDSYDCYSVDIGYPSGNYITNFSINNNELWSILYKNWEKMNLSDYSYDIDNKGNVIATNAPSLFKSPKYNQVTEEAKAWWSAMTQYPISATLTLKGLLKPALISQYVRVNTYFFGKKHISSGLYIITKQEDMIDTGGYRTTLSLTRGGGE